MTSTPPDTTDLTEAERAVAFSAIRVSRQLSARSPTTVPNTSDLLAFCSVKGQPLPVNIWDDVKLLATARTYISMERTVRLKTDTQWVTASQRQRIRLLHDVCNGEGDATYVDPESGYTVFSAFAHLRRGDCCGIPADGGERTHRCRHCPYDDAGDLRAPRYIALRDRLHVVLFVREGVTNNWTLPMSETDTIQSLPKDNMLQFSNEDAPVTTNNQHEHMTLPNRKSESSVTTWSKKEVRQMLRRLLVRKVDVEPQDDEHVCEACGDLQMVTCMRCKGWTILVSPVLRKCPQCEGEGMHACMHCTSFRPPPSTDIYS